MIPLSVLDLAPVNEGESTHHAFENTIRLAQTAEASGYQRIWMAEHHGMQGVASAATAVVLAHVGNHTQHIRIGYGGIMLPNHSPLVIAEQFGTLASLFPNRVDLGLGRAPGTDMMTAQALRRSMSNDINQYPADVQQLQSYLSHNSISKVTAIPGHGTEVPLWLLGSSLYSAQLAAQLGLPYSFASHFAPDQLTDAIKLYRQTFQPSRQQEKPYVMVGSMVVIADTDEEANYLFTSVQQQFVNLRRGNNRSYPRPVDSMHGHWTPAEKTMVDHTLKYALVGSKQTVAAKLDSFLELTRANELILSFPIHDIEARLKSVRLMADF